MEPLLVVLFLGGHGAHDAPHLPRVFWVVVSVGHAVAKLPQRRDGVAESVEPAQKRIAVCVLPLRHVPVSNKSYCVRFPTRPVVDEMVLLRPVRS
eukprot:2764803-Pyramimonas_sp.AAC.1